MSKASNIAQNGYEELIETGFDECLLSGANQWLRKYTNNEDGTCIDEATMGAIQAIGQGISMYVTFKVSEYLVDGMIKRAGLYWAYINMGKIGKIVKKKMPTQGFFGKAGGFLFKHILMSDSTATRVETMKLAQSEIGRFDKHSFEQQKIFSTNSQNVESQKNSAMKIKGNEKTKSIELFRHKTISSTWEKTTYDKKIFETVTGSKIATTGKLTWNKKVVQLNQLSAFAKDMEGNFVSHSQVLLDNMTMQNANRMS